MAARTSKRAKSTAKKKPRGKPFANGDDPRRNRMGRPLNGMSPAEFAAKCRTEFTTRQLWDIVGDIAESGAAKDRLRACEMLKNWGWGASPVTVDVSRETPDGDDSALAGILSKLAGIAANQASRAAAAAAQTEAEADVSA
jgi:hypothetical protein